MTLIGNLFSSPLSTLIFLLSIIIAITVHEFAHAWTAVRLGDDTPLHQGRVTLNPLAHLDPIGSLFFLLFRFGWGKPVIYDPRNLNRRVDELLIALAGPASNLLLAFILNLATFLQVKTGITLIQSDILGLIIQINVFLAAFNLVPIPPLDGSSIVAYFWPEYRSLAGGQVGTILIILLILPLGGSNLLGIIVNPIANFFFQLVTLFGLI